MTDSLKQETIGAEKENVAPIIIEEDKNGPAPMEVDEPIIKGKEEEKKEGEGVATPATETPETATPETATPETATPETATPAPAIATATPAIATPPPATTTPPPPATTTTTATPAVAAAGGETEEAKKEESGGEIMNQEESEKNRSTSTTPVVPIVKEKKIFPSAIPVREDNLNYSLRDMAGFDITPITETREIDLTARENVQFVVNQIFKLEREKTDWGVFAILPQKSTFRLPREKPCPKIKPPTRWEKFAQEKGIQKKKRGAMVWNDITKDWVPRHGYKSSKKIEERANFAIEVKEGSDPYENPFAMQKAEKDLTTAKQKMREMRNKVEAIGEKLPAGVTNFAEPNSKRHRGKENLKEALRRAQVSSASFGNFDKRAENEVVAKQPKKKKVKEVSASEEKSANLKLLSRIDNGVISKAKSAKIGQASLEQHNKKKNKVESGKVKKSGKRSRNGGKVRKGRKGQ